MGFFVDGVNGTWIWVLNIDVSCKFMNLFFCLDCGVFVDCGIVVRLWGGPYKWVTQMDKFGFHGPSYFFILLKIQSPNDPNGWTVQQFKTDGIVLPLPCIIYMYIMYNFKRFVWMSFNFQQFFSFRSKIVWFSSCFFPFCSWHKQQLTRLFGLHQFQLQAAAERADVHHGGE